MRALLPAAAILTSLLVAACGGGDNDDDATPGADEPFMDTSSAQLSDTDYVAALCDSIEEWVDAVNSKSTVDELRAARDKLEADARALHPPEGAADFQRAYVGYLQNAESEPTILITQPPPLPEGDLRARLAAVEPAASCEYPLFARSEATPTPGG
ncbi:MAG: hypothetical protein WD557_18505 [Dehalococcoidia bacterium]